MKPLPYQTKIADGTVTQYWPHPHDSRTALPVVFHKTNWFQRKKRGESLLWIEGTPDHHFLVFSTGL